MNHPDPSAAVRPLAVFDLDGTLIDGDSLLPFLLGYARRTRRVRADPADGLRPRPVRFAVD